MRWKRRVAAVVAAGLLVSGLVPVQASGATVKTRCGVTAVWSAGVVDQTRRVRVRLWWRWTDEQETTVQVCVKGIDRRRSGLPVGLRVVSDGPQVERETVSVWGGNRVRVLTSPRSGLSGVVAVGSLRDGPYAVAAWNVGDQG